MASDDAGMLGHRETGAPREPLCVRIERLSTGRAALAWIFVACSCAGALTLARSSFRSPASQVRMWSRGISTS